jgi:hypothetical protein
MENNWKDKIKQICDANAINLESFNLKGSDYELSDNYDCNQLLIAFEQFGNLVFEATKKECTDVIMEEDSLEENISYILNINKPNL